MVGEPTAYHSLGEMAAMQVRKNLPFLDRLRFALWGIAHGLRSEYSLRAQAGAFLAALIVLGVLRPAR